MKTAKTIILILHLLLGLSLSIVLIHNGETLAFWLFILHQATVVIFLGLEGWKQHKANLDKIAAYNRKQPQDD